MVPQEAMLFEGPLIAVFDRSVLGKHTPLREHRHCQQRNHRTKDLEPETRRRGSGRRGKPTRFEGHACTHGGC